MHPFTLTRSLRERGQQGETKGQPKASGFVRRSPGFVRRSQSSVSVANYVSSRFADALARIPPLPLGEGRGEGGRNTAQLPANRAFSAWRLVQVRS
jgi:hypothetical protein